MVVRPDPSVSNCRMATPVRNEGFTSIVSEEVLLVIVLKLLARSPAFSNRGMILPCVLRAAPRLMVARRKVVFEVDLFIMIFVFRVRVCVPHS